ncbi:hypothetical protein J6590_010991 [Homalodisca vitripennis]|nr:hypothetical protein J6590_010991 [Homalodisca vitripennis]
MVIVSNDDLLSLTKLVREGNALDGDRPKPLRLALAQNTSVKHKYFVYHRHKHHSRMKLGGSELCTLPDLLAKLGEPALIKEFPSCCLLLSRFIVFDTSEHMYLYEKPRETKGIWGKVMRVFGDDSYGRS